MDISVVWRRYMAGLWFEIEGVELSESKLKKVAGVESVEGSLPEGALAAGVLGIDDDLDVEAALVKSRWAKNVTGPVVEE